MQRLTFALLLFVTPPLWGQADERPVSPDNPFAERWVEVGRTDEVVVSFDHRTARDSTETAVVWFQWAYQARQATSRGTLYDRQLNLETIGCQARTFATHRTILYLGDDVVLDYPELPARAEVAVPGSIGEHILMETCLRLAVTRARKRARPQ